MSTKKNIIEAATWLFAERGYEGMTMKEIAKEVGIKPPSVYAFFESKEDVFVHICDLLLGKHYDVASSEPEVQQTQSVHDQLKGMLWRIVDYQYRDDLQMKILIRLLLFPPDVYKQNISEMMNSLEVKERQMFADIFRRGMQSGELREVNPEAQAVAMINLMDGVFWSMQRYEQAEMVERLELIWEQFWEGIKR